MLEDEAFKTLTATDLTVVVEDNASYDGWELDATNGLITFRGVYLQAEKTITVSYSKTYDAVGTYENTVTAYAGYWLQVMASATSLEDVLPMFVPMASDSAEATVTVANRTITTTTYYDVTVNYYIEGTTTTLRASNTIANRVNGMSYDVEASGFVYDSLDLLGDTYTLASADAPYSGTINRDDVVINIYYAASGTENEEEETEETEEEVPLAETPDDSGVSSEAVEEEETPLAEVPETAEWRPDLSDLREPD